MNYQSNKRKFIRQVEHTSSNGQTSVQSNRRKHRFQMSSMEINLLEGKIHSYSELKLSPHALARMNEKDVTEQEIRQTLRYGRVIEVHNNIADDIRALVRLDRKKKAATCVVISLCSGEVKTAYKNDKGDNHKTLDASQYMWNANMAQTLCVI
jgi:hypothetical protein